MRWVTLLAECALDTSQDDGGVLYLNYSPFLSGTCSIQTVTEKNERVKQLLFTTLKFQSQFVSINKLADTLSIVSYKWAKFGVRESTPGAVRVGGHAEDFPSAQIFIHPPIQILITHFN